MKRTKIVEVLAQAKPRRDVTVMGWVRTKRGSKKIAFIELNDGSTINNVQIVVPSTIKNFEDVDKVTTGASLMVRGALVESRGSGQKFEIKAKEVKVFGYADPTEYPIQKKDMTLEMLRKVAHLRPRTNTFGAVFRVRNALAFAVHRFFQEKGFVYAHTPIITGSDCEGAGEMFRVTTLDLNDVPKNDGGEIDLKKEFFGKETNLTVSGQLEGELMATALGEIYTFGPTFRAENSHTPRHASEFWMIEPEMAFYDLEDNMTLAEDFVKYIIQHVLDNCKDDLAFFETTYEKDLRKKLTKVAKSKFKRITYTEAIKILEKCGEKFEFPVKWGIDLQAEHEKYLTDKHFKGPVIVVDYPKDIKAFYMKLNKDKKTVKAMDVLVPHIGEIIGGSEREEDHDTLVARIHESRLNLDDYSWYLDTRKFGTVPHSGFGLGFERMLMYVTGMPNIRDVIPFPRTPNNAEF